jgi:protein-L-isoaspartate(D-aspartate) O-methyltransferase
MPRVPEHRAIARLVSPREARDNTGMRTGVLTVATVGMLLACEASPRLIDSKQEDAAFQTARDRMVRDQIAARGITNERVLAALGRVPRHRFVPAAQRDAAYGDHPLPIGHGQTISQPYIVALMTDLADLQPGESVLEIGTGSGYQAAVLAEMGVRVKSIEIVPPLAEDASHLLRELGYDGIEVRAGDGYRGWPEGAPFDAILVTAAPPEIPQPLVEQLAIGGRLVVPVGTQLQELVVKTRTPEGLRDRTVLPVRFVPMTGEAQKAREEE